MKRGKCRFSLACGMVSDGHVTCLRGNFIQKLLITCCHFSPIRRNHLSELVLMTSNSLVGSVVAFDPPPLAPHISDKFVNVASSRRECSQTHSLRGGTSGGQLG
uniref:Uncharacterized protein n=1 Tax=Rhizophora mucronata TaxID=61149 RepID=A0A2P2MBA1_RHIMU